MSPTNVSSSGTIFWKFVFPIFWTVFFLTLALGVTFSEIKPTAIPKMAFSILLWLTLSLGVLLMVLTLLRLKRVEMDGEFLYVTNYFKWYRYPYHNVASLTERDFVLFKLVTVAFNEPGKFGKRVFFLANHRRLDAFLQEHPEVAKQVFGGAG
jgi:hypothetical protein